MKKRFVFWAGIILAAGLVLSGCASAKGVVYSETVPPEQRAFLMVPGGFWDVTAFDGNPVRWYKATIGGGTRVEIPGGKHTLTLNYYNNRGGRVKLMDVQLTVAFEAGHEYELRAQKQDDGNFLLSIFDTTAQQEVEVR